MSEIAKKVPEIVSLFLKDFSCVLTQFNMPFLIFINCMLAKQFWQGRNSVKGAVLMVSTYHNYTWADPAFLGFHIFLKYKLRKIV